MDPQSSSASRNFNSADAALAFLALIGLLAFVFMLPAQHIDSAGSFELTEQGAIDRATTFLASQGYHTENLEISAKLTRNDRLLTAMQEDLGRRQTLDILRSTSGIRLPAYLWTVIYDVSDLESASSFSIFPMAQVFSVRLTADGDILSFSNTTSDVGTAAVSIGSPTQAVNRTVLSKLFGNSDSLEADALQRLRLLSDSLLIANLRFARPDAPGGRSPTLTGNQPDRIRQLENGRVVTLDSTSLQKLAAFHAPNAALPSAVWELDSLRVLPDRPARLAAVRLRTAQPIEGQHFRTDLVLSATGNLQSLDVLSNPGREGPSVVSETIGGVKIGGYVLIFVFLLILFVRRLIGRLIDVKGSMLDALVLGVLIALTVVLQRDIGIDVELEGWARVGASLLIFSVTGGATALFVFIISASAESVTREVLPGKLHSSILVRRGDTHNQLVGWAILRGIAVGGVLLGVGVLSLTVMPKLALEMSETLGVEQSLRPVASSVAFGVSASYIKLLLILLGIGTMFYRIWPKAWFMVIAVTLSGGLLQVAPFGLEASWLAVGVSLLVAFIVAVTYVRYDFLTTLIALFVAGLAWQMSEGFLIAVSPGWIDTLLASLVVLTLAIFGVVGVISRRTGGDANQYVPQYIQEMAGQERIKRELEIAYQVQASFLPRYMPDVEGLDLAGMCLPASEIGGDYFDFIRLPDGRLAFVVGDVSGKGIQAAFYMTLVKGVIQALSTMVASPRTVMHRLNEVFRRNAPAGTFISAIYGVVDPATGDFTFARAGHNPAILKRAASDSPEFLLPTGMAIGFADGALFEQSIEEVSIKLLPGDIMVFYTDGFSEAMNSKRELFGDDRLLEKVGHVGNRSASGILRSLTESVHHFIEGTGRSDDMTMVVVKRAMDP